MRDLTHTQLWVWEVSTDFVSPGPQLLSRTVLVFTVDQGNKNRQQR